MKVLHIAQMTKGGIASYLNEILPFQHQVFGARAVLVALPADEVQFIAVEDPSTLKTVTAKGRTIRGLVQFLVEILRIIRRERPDILHLHSSFAGAVIRAWFLLRPWRRPAIVYCAHGWAFNMQVSETRRRVYARLERLFARVTDAIISISGFEHEQAVGRGLPAALLHCIPNGVSDQPPVHGRDTNVFDPRTLNLLFVGRQDRQKGFDLLIEAMRALQGHPITLHVVGEAVVSRTDIGSSDLPNVVRHGWKAQHEVPFYMASADALIMPSRWEGFGLTAVEAMRQGLPVCASSVDALPDLIREGVSGYLFPADDVKALTALLATLDRNTLKAMGPHARQWFLDHHTAERMNRAVVDVYEKVACRSTNGGCRGGFQSSNRRAERLQ